jgi:hypothetical protein
MFHDPIVDEVRAIREKLAAQFDFDLAKIFADAQKRQAESGAKVVSFERAPSLAPPNAEMSAERGSGVST